MELRPWQKLGLRTILGDINDIAAGKPPSHIGTIIAGPPGTGKSVLIDATAKEITQEFPKLALRTTATTGAASSRLACESSTLASWFGIGEHSMKLDKLGKILPILSKKKPANVMETQVLIIEEVSMLSKQQLDNLSEICSRLRSNPEPYGGMYVILVGDPLQLPPVAHDGGFGEARAIKNFVPSCLESYMRDYNYVVANEMIRSDGDKPFQGLMLGMIRPTAQEREHALKELHRRKFTKELTMSEILDLQERTGATILTATKASVTNYNTSSRERAKLMPDYCEYKIPPPRKLHASLTPKNLNTTQKDLSAEEKCIEDRDTWPKDNTLRKNVFYMIRLNMKTNEEVSVVNGDTGTVIGYNSDTNTVTFQLSGSKKVVNFGLQKFKSEWNSKIGFEAIPLIEASAMTVHKAQGATLSCGLILDPSEFRNYNGYLAHMIYTAISRARSLDHVYLTGILHHESLTQETVQAKLDYIWKLKYMRHYLTPDKILI